jgi:hypothetical protein
MKSFIDLQTHAVTPTAQLPRKGYREYEVCLSEWGKSIPSRPTVVRSALR